MAGPPRLHQDLTPPLGLVFDPAGNLYVANYASGVINKVSSDRTVTVFAAVVPRQNSIRVKMPLWTMN